MEKIGAENALSLFNCGQRPVDHWARKSALKLHKKGRHKVYLASAEGYESPIGFYSLSMAHRKAAKLLRQEDRDGWHMGAPFVFLDWLGVHKDHQNKGVGRILLADAINRTMIVNDIVPVYGLALSSLNKETTNYYEKLGFRMAPGESADANPLMILPIFTIVELF
ncbi:GNAT family N-acetyltransferase [Fuscibacter oryzae]|uniref:GNAT family N-acetyltransferase n=1 Tax=Fuscibacter oryzae TaxID=2803939 RepID=UPI002E2AD336|nr:GNAT family N-acetyltransferase [Fuscibacter oryzae]